MFSCFNCSPMERNRVPDLLKRLLLASAMRPLASKLLLLGALGFGIAWYVGGFVFPKFPRRVLITPDDLWGLAGVVVLISVLSSLLGIWKAMRVEPNTVLS